MLACGYHTKKKKSGMEAKNRTKAKKHVYIAITILWTDFAVIGVEPCSTMTAIFFSPAFSD